jgi:hypothetical protein
MGHHHRINLLETEVTLLAELEPCAAKRQKIVPRIDPSPAELDEGGASTRMPKRAGEGEVYGKRLIDGFDGVLADLDGVVYTGPQAIDGATEALDRLVGEGKSLAYVTNNASRSSEEVAACANWEHPPPLNRSSGLPWPVQNCWLVRFSPAPLYSSSAVRSSRTPSGHKDSSSYPLRMTGQTQSFRGFPPNSAGKTWQRLPTRSRRALHG